MGELRAVAILKMPPLHLNPLESLQLHLLAQQAAQIALARRTASIDGLLTQRRLIKAAAHIQLFTAFQAVQAHIHSITCVMRAALSFRVLQHILIIGRQSQISQLTHRPGAVGIPQHQAVAVRCQTLLYLA